jgi:dTDP-4-dehydrorhamnose 3,5-epimerase-like enzyme
MANNITVWDSSLIQIKKVKSREGNLSIVENGVDLPFDVKRVFYIYDIPGGESRGAHAHKECHQFLVAVSGAFEVLLDDGRTQRLVQLNRPYHGLHIPPGLWASEINFSSGAVCLVLTSHTYNETDYIRSYDDYLSYIRK